MHKSFFNMKKEPKYKISKIYTNQEWADNICSIVLSVSSTSSGK